MKKKFKIIDFEKEGKGVKKDAKVNFTFTGFFKLLKRKFFDLSGANLLWLLINFPLFFTFVALSGNFDIAFSNPADPLYPALDGVSKFTQNPMFMALWGISGKNVEMAIAGPIAKVLYALTGISIFTFGFANTGLAYVLRNHAREDYVDMPGDFFSAIKKNFWQSLTLGIVDVIVTFALLFSAVFYYTNSSYNFFFSMLSFFSIFLILVWIVMHFYMYQLLVTFKLSNFKILKNSFIFAMVGLKRNVVGLIGIALTIALNVIIYIYFLPLGGLLPFFITIALVSFIGTYSAYPNIKKIMIDPYYSSTDHIDSTPDEETIFTDRG